MSASSGPRGGDRGEATDLGTHTENSDGATLAANTAVDARGGSPQGAHLSGAATPRPPRGRRRQNQNGLDTTQVSSLPTKPNIYEVDVSRAAICLVRIILLRWKTSSVEQKKKKKKRQNKRRNLEGMLRATVVAYPCLSLNKCRKESILFYFIEGEAKRFCTSKMIFLDLIRMRGQD